MSKRIQPTDQDEETRARSMFEQCWFGPLGTLVFVIVFLALIHNCQGAECKLAWDPNDPRDMVTEYRVYLGTFELARVTTTTAEILLPNAPCEVAVVAVKGSLQSPPATLKLAYVDVIDMGDNLLNTRILTGRHVEYWPGRRFYKGRIQIPP